MRGVWNALRRRGSAALPLAAVVVMGLAGTLALPVKGATITNQFRTGNFLVPGAALRWELLSDPYVAEDGTIVTKDVFYTALTRGFLSNRVYGGTYRVTVGSGTPAEIYTLPVPHDEGFYAFYQLVTNSISFATNMPRTFVTGATNVAGTNLGVFKQKSGSTLEFLGVVAGSGLTITNQGGTQLVFTVTSSGAGTVTGSTNIGSGVGLGRSTNESGAIELKSIAVSGNALSVNSNDTAVTIASSAPSGAEFLETSNALRRFTATLVGERMITVVTDATNAPATALLRLSSEQNAVRVWTGTRPVSEAYLDIFVRTNTSDTATTVRLTRWQGRIIKVGAGATVYLGTTNGATLTVAGMTVPDALPSPTGETNYVTADQAGPPYWVPANAHVTLPSNGMAFLILTNRKETPIFVSEFDGVRWSPMRWYITETNANLNIQCTFRQVAIATFGGDTFRVVAPTGSVVGGASSRMSLLRAGGNRKWYVTTASNLLHACTNAVAGDTILIADGTYTLTTSIVAATFATNQARGYVGSEGITIRSVSGNRDGVRINANINIVATGSTMPSYWRDLTFDFDASTNFFTQIEGRLVCENVRWEDSAAVDLVNIGDSGGVVTADLLWCSVFNGAEDLINANGSASSVLRLIGMDGAISMGGAAGQIVTTHGAMPLEIYGGVFSSANTSVFANGSDAAPIWAFFCEVSAGTNKAGVVNSSLFGCFIPDDPTILVQNTNGYVMFSSLNRNLNGNVAAAANPVYWHNRMKTSTYAAQPRRGGLGYVGNIFYSSFSTTVRVVDFSSDSGPVTFIGNTVYSATTAFDFGSTNLFGRLTNNATLNSGTSILVSSALNGWVRGNYNTFDPTVDADYTVGASDITNANASLDARWIPVASGNCDTNGAPIGFVGDADPYGHVWILDASLVPRGARARQVVGGYVFPDAW